MDAYESLAAYRRCRDRITEAWPSFGERRLQRLQQEQRFGSAPEKSVELIVADLLTGVLDWSPADLNHQLGRADIVVSRVGLKALLVETKRPGALAWSPPAVRLALGQAWRYAHEQKVPVVAISDGILFYAEEWVEGGPLGRAFVDLRREEPDLELWWLSVEGIYRPRPADAALVRLPSAPGSPDGGAIPSGELLHPKYRLPARCFAYVGDSADPHSWHLPYLLADGGIDPRRLPKAIQSIVSNYRGAHVSSIPERAIPSVLQRLAEASARAGHLPPASAGCPPAYGRLWACLDQFEVLACVKREILAGEAGPVRA